ncbi:hypothetical protein PR048_032667 [Dryococelus australis]|uniref:Uncharacterized protein n=1 Tax=Dryococelus australis TaxID=614101 RepID=A0ABQ9G724_9NEOP|nr:hypothetical protein PR048_032667 [Dryococelus australis]
MIKMCYNHSKPVLILECRDRSGVSDFLQCYSHNIDSNYNREELDVQRQGMVNDLHCEPMIVQEDSNSTQQELVDDPDFEPNKDDSFQPDFELDPEVAAENKSGEQPENEMLKRSNKKKKQKGNKAVQRRRRRRRKGQTYISKTKKTMSIFTEYWELDSPGKRSFVLSCLKETPKARSYVTHASRRSRTFQYYLPLHEERVRIRQQFILKTLDLSHRILSYTYDHRSDLLTAKPDQRGKKTPPNKTPEMAERQVTNFIESLPTVPSHYCRSECDGKWGANKICSNVSTYLYDLEIRMPEVKANARDATSFCTTKSVQEISITYLLPGHIYMPADSMHPIIVSNYRKKIIWAPSEWPTIIINSRINPRQYEANVRTYNDSQDWKGIQGIPLSSACQMRSVPRATIQKKETHIALSRRYDDDSRPPQNIRVQDIRRMSTSEKKLSIKTVYTSCLPVSAAKKDLVALYKKNVIPT